MILIDWGTTRMRAFRLDGAGIVVDTRSSDTGIMQVRDRDFAGAAAALVGDWHQAGDAGRPVPVLMCGMIGSRQGWVEAPYLACPAGFADIAGAVMPVPAWADSFIIPGMSSGGLDGDPDVMRGEETQLFGVLAHLGIDQGLFCLPGTHAKWVAVEDGRIVRFATAMTGEIFQATSEHTILRALMAPAEEAAAAGFDALSFGVGLKRAQTPGGLLHHLFSARSLGLFGRLAPIQVRAYLSGLLVGHEVAETPAALGPAFAETRDIVLVVSGAQEQPYRAALEAFGYRVTLVPVEAATVAGMTAIATQAGMASPAGRSA